MFSPKLKIPNLQRYQSPDGNYLSDVNVVLQGTGGVLMSDPGPEVFVAAITLSIFSDAVSYRGFQGDGTANLRT